MSLSMRDSVLLGKMLSEITDIELFVSDLDGEAFAKTRIAQKAVVMTFINIGELAKSFTDDFLEKTKHIPWRKIRGLRNLAAHHYDAVDMVDIWHTIKRDIPVLKKALLRAEEMIFY